MEAPDPKEVRDLIERGDNCAATAPAEGRARWMRNYWPRVSAALDAAYPAGAVPKGEVGIQSEGTPSEEVVEPAEEA